MREECGRNAGENGRTGKGWAARLLMAGWSWSWCQLCAIDGEYGPARARGLLPLLRGFSP